MKAFSLKMIVFIFFLTSCKRKDTIEIFLTKERIESYDGIPFNSAIEDTVLLNRVYKLYGSNLRYDTINKELLFMGRFNASKEDLEETPFILDEEIIGLDTKDSKIYFTNSVSKKIYTSLNKWREKGGFLGKQFVICLNGEIVSNGYFDSMFNRYYCKTNKILFYNNKDIQKNVGFIIDSSNIEIGKLDKNSTIISIFKNRKIN